MTGSREVAARWGESFYYISQNIRSHGRLYVVDDPELGRDLVCYDPQSRTAFLINFDYYGWIKSLGLSLAGDILEDNHSIFSVHGACLDISGRGLCILGGPGAGKTTHTYGLLRRHEVRAVSDDWFFGRVFGEDILAFGSEKSFYIRSELATIWKEFSPLVETAEMDALGRGVIDLRRAVGKGRILPLTTLKTAVILKRDPGDPVSIRELGCDQALDQLVKSGYYNPHILVKGGLKDRLRKSFFGDLLSRVVIWDVNTTGSPQESSDLILSAARDPS